MLITVLLSTSLAGRELVATPGALLVVCAAMIRYNVAAAASRWAWLHVSQATFMTLLLDLGALTTYLRFAGDVENPLRVVLHHTLAASSEGGSVVRLIRDVTKARRGPSVPSGS